MLSRLPNDDIYTTTCLACLNIPRDSKYERMDLQFQLRDQSLRVEIQTGQSGQQNRTQVPRGDG